MPYVIALVEFDEGPRLPGILLDERGPGVATGQRVRVELTAFPGADERPEVPADVMVVKRWASAQDAAKPAATR